MLETYLNLLDLCYFEVTEAFKSLADEHVWKRPDSGLLSVGELAGHVAYWEAVRFAGEGIDGSSSRDLSTCRVSSPLLDPRFAYYTTNLATPPSEGQVALTATQVLNELLRVHRESMALLKALNPDMESAAPHWHSTNVELLKYVVFHIAYHTGQMYSVRHLLGEETPDN
ncbi:MAG: DinB family protein [Armatimonadetes bacterium]|nr:DinB family protein [Armatimonadota bacterium]